MLRFVAMQLADLEVLEADDGVAAVGLVRQRRPMLALIDPMMPELSEPLSLGALSLRTGFKVRCLCEALEVSDRQLHRLFSDSLGINPKDWLRRER